MSPLRIKELDWIAEDFDRSRYPVTSRPVAGLRFECPCCDYPTLEERGGYEICERRSSRMSFIGACGRSRWTPGKAGSLLRCVSDPIPHSWYPDPSRGTRALHRGGTRRPSESLRRASFIRETTCDPAGIRTRV